jgi:hypothetical protein
VGRDQLGFMQRTENELTRNINVPLNVAVPVAGGSLAFILRIAGIR